MPEDPASALRDGLHRRIAELRAAAGRLDAFAFRPDERPREPDSDADDAAAVEDLLLRALRCAGDPVNMAILKRLGTGDAPLPDLAAVARLPRLAAWERINDLVQAGLAVRDLEGDRASLTQAGAALVRLVSAVVGDALPVV